MEYNPTPKNEVVNSSSGSFGKFIVYLSFILIIPVFLYVLGRNRLIRLQQSLEETSSDIDVQLKRRVDLLTKLVDSTKQYMSYEKSTLKDIVGLRSKLNTDGKLSVDDANKLNSAVTNSLGKVNFLMENYPNLKANETVLELQASIKDCEDNIAAARRLYNSTARDYNGKLRTWPINVAASNMKLYSYKFYEAADQDRKDVKIDLGQ